MSKLIPYAFFALTISVWLINAYRVSAWAVGYPG